MVPELKKHRSHLLAALHKDQKQIDCLGYLLYKVKYPAAVAKCLQAAAWLVARGNKK